ncbi:MAG: AI-2E family transporter [Thiovulaceae bacterium]|nr:AI-2E family transporter [Sulfurimonadaceae bacterium]
MENHKFGYAVLVMACVVVVLAGVKSAAEIIVPFLLALFLAIILSPAHRFFMRKKIPEGLSITVIMVLVVLFLLLVAKLIGSSVREFSANIDVYTQNLYAHQAEIETLATKFGFEIASGEIASIAEPKQVMGFVQQLLQGVGAMFTNGFVIILTVIFMLLEASHFTQKIAQFDTDKKTMQQIEVIFAQINEYMVIKAGVSLLTGFIVWIGLLFVGVDYPFLWAVLAFLLNFIPNIGSIIAAVPPVLLALVQLGSMSALVVGIIYTLVNVLIGSVLEPKVMGKGLGLSTLVVFLSLIFWGWLLGIVGMLLSVPLTIMAKIVFDADPKTKWISILLGTGEMPKSAQK